MRRIRRYRTIGEQRSLCPEPHWLKEVFRSEKIPLWKLRNCTGVPESRLSRYLNGIDPMPQDLHGDLLKLSFALSGKLDEYEIIHNLTVKAHKTLQEKLKAEDEEEYQRQLSRLEEMKKDKNSSYWKVVVPNDEEDKDK